MGADLSVNNESVAETQETGAEVVTTDVNTDSSETIEAEGQQLAEGSEAEIQSDEENAKYAAARRRAEQEFAKRQRESDLAFERRFAGYTNPITGQPIRSQKDYFDALDAQEKLQMEQSLQSGSVTADELNSYIEKQINNNPAILQAQQIIEANRYTVSDSALWIYGSIFFLYFFTCWPISLIAKQLEKRWKTV